MYLKIVKIYFHVLRPHFGPFWSVKYISFGQKLQIQTAHHTFLESRHPEVNKNPHYILSPVGSQKKLLAHGLVLVVRESKCMEIQKFRSSAKPRKFLPLKQSQKKSEYMKFTYFTNKSFIWKGQVKYKECNKSNLLKHTLPTKTRDIDDMQPNKIRFSRNVAHLEFLFSAFRIQKLFLEFWIK